MNFFDPYTQFFTTSATSASPSRLNARHAAIIQGNPELLRGKHVLDIASHDGRWSFAALHAGAKHVTGIEIRPDLVQNAHSTFKQYGVDAGRYTFIQGDVFDVLGQNQEKFDVVLCLGYLYHTIRHADLIDLMDRTGAGHIIIDTEIVCSPLFDDERSSDFIGPRRIWSKPVSIQLIEEPVENESMAGHNTATRNGMALVARPSVEIISILMGHFGFSSRQVDWSSILVASDNVGTLKDYQDGWRGTFICTRL